MGYSHLLRNQANESADASGTVAMNVRMRRLAAVMAVTGAMAQLVASVLEPDWGGDAEAAARVVAGSGVWMGDRLLDLFGLLLTVGALTVVGRTFGAGPGREWARTGQPFLILMGALGSSAVVLQAVMKDLADTWVAAATTPPYLAAFDAVSAAAEDMFFVAFLALGLYLAALSTAIVTGRVYPRWIGWATALAAASILAGNLAQLAVEPAWLAVLAGFALAMVAQMGLGVMMWRHARRV